MPRAGRLTSPADFRRAFVEGRRAGTRTVVAHVREAAGRPGEIRIGVSASRRLGGSVQRNRAKRLLREAARGLVGLRSGIDVVLVGTPAAGGATFQELVDNVRQAVQRAGGLRE